MPQKRRSVEPTTVTGPPGSAPSPAPHTRPRARQARPSRRTPHTAELLESIFMNAPAPVLMIDARDRVLAANHAALALLAPAGPDLCGRPVAELVQGMQGLLGSARERVLTPLFLADGRRVAAAVLRSATRSGAYRAVIFHELTPAVEEERRQARVAQLAEAGELAAHIGHDVKNALATILATLQYLESGEPSPEQATTSLRHAEDEVRRLTQTAQNLLAAAQPAPRLPRPMDLGAAMREILQHLGCARNRRVRLTVAGEADGTLAVVDPVGLRRVVLNLLLNALDAAPIGSAVRIDWRALSATEAAARFPGCPGGAVCLSVTDEGPGIPADVLRRVVEPFFTTKPTGTGLGLAVVSQIVRAHGGALEFLSRPGQGTRVEVFLPSPGQAMPCWDIRECGPPVRHACRVWREGSGFGCWSANHESLRAMTEPVLDRCLACPVYRTSVLPLGPAARACRPEDA